jgi:hypothetical protein
MNKLILMVGLKLLSGNSSVEIEFECLRSTLREISLLRHISKSNFYGHLMSSLTEGKRAKLVAGRCITEELNSEKVTSSMFP